MAQVEEIEPTELKELLEANAKVLLLDVRQPEEHDLVNLAGSTLIPLDQLPQRLEEVRQHLKDNYKSCIVYCRAGGRSASAIEWLEENGITGLLNLRGGINAYAREVDTNLKPY